MPAMWKGQCITFIKYEMCNHPESIYGIILLSFLRVSSRNSPSTVKILWPSAAHGVSRQ